jgi:MoaA/NifB/PqqE/SkfB family radical SAM enzyme
MSSAAAIQYRADFLPAPPLPQFLQVEVVGQCNLRCRMCAIQFRRDGPPHGPLAFMPFERFVALLEQFPRLRELHLQGLGEPTMHPRFFDMVRHAARRGLRVSTNSNLTLLSQRRARLVVDSGLAELSVYWRVRGALRSGGWDG